MSASFETLADAFRRTLTALTAIICVAGAPADAQSKFDIESPTNLDALSRIRLWSTHYYVQTARQVGPPNGHPIVGRAPWNVTLGLRDWCLMAVEGTGVVSMLSGGEQGFNYRAVGSQRFADCSAIITSIPTNSMNRTLYDKLPPDAPFGIGSAPDTRLLPFRSLAADASLYPRGTVIYLPDLKSKGFKDVDGAMKSHDGYMIVGDVGGAIRGAHIDFFTGTVTTNPFPSLVTSSPNGKFDAYLVNTASVLTRLRREQTR